MTEPDYAFADLSKRNYYPKYACEACAAAYRLSARGSEVTVTRKADGVPVRAFDAA